MTKKTKLIITFFFLPELALFFLFIVLTITGLTYEPDLTIPEQFDGNQLIIEDLTIRYQQIGAGEDVLLIHGQGGSMEDFDPIMDDLTRNYRVTRYDRPGHGFSDNRDDVHSFQANARIAVELMEALNLVNPVIVGHSYGGGVALAVAANHNIDCQGVVLLGSVGYPCGEIECKERGALENLNRMLFTIPYFGEGLAMVLSSSAIGDLGSSIAKDMAYWAFHPNIEHADDYFEKNQIKILSPKNVVANYQQEAVYNDSIRNLTDNYHLIEQPVTIIQGEEDNYSELIQTAHKLNEDIPNSRLIMLENTGHMINFVHPEVVVQEVNNLME